MSISVPQNKQSRNRYAAAALFCAVFAGVYEAFSHGVVSPWMLALPAYPLAGAVVFHLLYLKDIRTQSWFHALRLCGVATLTISYYDIGYKTGEMAYEILVNGADVAAMPIAYAPLFTKKYNAVNAAELGITIPDDYQPIETAE